MLVNVGVDLNGQDFFWWGDWGVGGVGGGRVIVLLGAEVAGWWRRRLLRSSFVRALAFLKQPSFSEEDGVTEGESHGRQEFKGGAEAPRRGIWHQKTPPTPRPDFVKKGSTSQDKDRTEPSLHSRARSSQKAAVKKEIGSRRGDQKRGNSPTLKHLSCTRWDLRKGCGAVDV